MQKKENLKKLGTKLREFRTSRGFSSGSIRLGLGITRQMLSEYECGKKCMRQERIMLWCLLLNLSDNETREIYDLYAKAYKETYSYYSEAAKLRERKLKNAWFFKDFMI